MENEIIQQILEGQGLTQEQIADVMAELKVASQSKSPIVQAENEERFEWIKKMDEATTWQDRAKYAARIISKSLE